MACGVSLLLLAACGGPGKSDVEAAVTALYPGTRTTGGFTIEDSTKTDTGDYAVKVSYDTKGGGGPLGDPPGHYTFRFVMTKTGSHWRIIDAKLLAADPLR